MPVYHVTYFPKERKYEVNFVASNNVMGVEFNLDELLETVSGNLTVYTQSSSYAAALGHASYLTMMHQATAPNPVEVVSAETKALRNTLDVLVKYMRATINDVEAGNMLEAVRSAI